MVGVRRGERERESTERERERREIERDYRVETGDRACKFLTTRWQVTTVRVQIIPRAATILLYLQSICSVFCVTTYHTVRTESSLSDGMIY